jgi:hypothetical protein
MTDDVDQTLLLLAGVFGGFIVLLMVLAAMEHRLDDPSADHPAPIRRRVRAALHRLRDRGDRSGDGQRG